jgi:hypothetical protein
MLRILLRLVGYLMLAGAFVTLVIDGTRSIAANALLFLRIGEVLDRFAPAAQAMLKARLEPLAPALWDPVATHVLAAPLALALLGLGVLLVLLAAEREPAVGYLARR